MKHYLLSPLTRLLSRMKYGQKFLLLSILFLIPLAFLLTLWLRDMNGEMAETQKERVGVDYIRNVMPIVLQVQQHRGLANGLLNGDQSSEAKVKEIEQQIASSLSAVESFRESHEALNGTAEAWKALRQEWETLQKEMRSLAPADSFEKHSALIAKMTEFITLLADETGLTLDSQIDTNYLIDAMARRLPAVMESTAYSRGMGNGILTRKRLSADEKVELMLSQNEIENHLTGLRKSLTAASGYNSALAEGIDAPGQEATEAIGTYLGVLDSGLISAGSLTMQPGQFFAEGARTIDKANGLFEAVSGELERLLEERADALAAERLSLTLVLGVALLLAAGVFVGFYINVVHTLRQLQREAERIASGDLSREVVLDTKDELSLIGSAFNMIQQSLNDLLWRNQHISEQLAASSQQLSAVSIESSQAMRQIADAVSGIAEGAEQQQSVAAENSIALQEMAEGVGRIAEASSDVAAVSSAANASAGSGAGKLGAAVEQMRRIQSSVSLSGETVRTLGEHSQRIDELTAIILDISSQTQLLSLNANIEAARAGEHGRGFAVVASEVAKLAEQSKQSVETITGVVATIRSMVDQTRQAMDRTSADAERGLSMIGQADEEIGRMKDAIQQVAGQIEEVSAAAQQLAAGTEQVSAAFAESAVISRKAAEEAMSMAAATQQQLASIEEVQFSAESLSGSAVKLQEELGRFTLADSDPAA